MAMPGDKWSRWLKEERWGDHRDLLEAALNSVRDHILALARVQPNDRVLDLGSGTGLLGLRAAEMVGSTGTVAFLDISADSLKTAVSQASVGCERFLVADVLHCPIRDGWANVAIMRSVLIYITDRLTAAREIARVLPPGGRFVAFEPINRRMEQIIDMTGFEDIEAATAAAMDSNPLTNFDEDDLVEAFELAGFDSAEIEMSESRFPVRGREWAHGFKHGAPAGYSAYDMLLSAGISAERADEFVVAGERQIGDEWRVWGCPAVYLKALR